MRHGFKARKRILMCCYCYDYYYCYYYYFFSNGSDFLNQGGTADLPKPLRPNDSRMHKKDDRVVEESNARSTQSPTRPIEVNPNSLMKYAQ